MSTEIIMPDLGAASDEAVLVTWFVREGDRVEVGQPMYEIETDKRRQVDSEASRQSTGPRAHSCAASRVTVTLRDRML